MRNTHSAEKIHIGDIEETQIPRDPNFKLSGYRIITSTEVHIGAGIQGLPTGGVAVLVRGDLEKTICTRTQGIPPNRGNYTA